MKGGRVAKPLLLSIGPLGSNHFWVRFLTFLHWHFNGVPNYSTYMYFPRDIFQKFILEYMYCYNFLRLSWGHGWTWKAYFSTNYFLAHKYFNLNFDFETVSHIWFSNLLDLEGRKNSMPHPLLHNGTIQLICISFYHNNRIRISWKRK